MEPENKLHVDSVLNWFGTDGAVRDGVSRQLAGCNWIGVPFVGGMGMLSALKCNQGVATDLHHHAINLAQVLADPRLADQMAERLAAMPLHPVALSAAKERCREREVLPARMIETPFLFAGGSVDDLLTVAEMPNVAWAVDYFITSWMSRAGSSGTPAEFKPSDISVRWKATGGSSSGRWRSAVNSIPGWSDVLKRWTFVCMDAFGFLDQCWKVEQATTGILKNGLYLDPPFPGAGDAYTHNFSQQDQERLARSVMRFQKTKVCIRFHDCETIRTLYPANYWTFIELPGRAQTNEARPEVLITNRVREAVAA